MRIDDNVPDDWGRWAQRCHHCGRTYHPAEGCDCEACQGCGDSLPPERLSDDGLCALCESDPDRPQAAT